MEVGFKGWNGVERMLALKLRREEDTHLDAGMAGDGNGHTMLAVVGMRSRIQDCILSLCVCEEDDGAGAFE